MQHRVPFWFVRWYNSIMVVFNNVYHQANISNVFIIPSFPNPEFEADCVHLTEECGQRYSLTMLKMFLCTQSMERFSTISRAYLYFPTGSHMGATSYSPTSTQV